MTYNDALKYIGSRLRFGIKPGLDRTRGLLCRLGNPQKKLKFVHVAGTNGKGSTCVMTAAALCESGLRTGLYTSPYICDFRERMQINGRMIEPDELAALTERVSLLIDDDEQITEFELITCIAITWFAEMECDVVVLETGLGGRLDSTNVIDSPLCSVITRIDLDHTAILGDTVTAIAGEKAGIIKAGAPVVMACGQLEGAAAVIENRAKTLSCKLIVPDFSRVKILSMTLDGTDILYSSMRLHIPLLGRHQITNAITAVEILRLLGISDNTIAAGISKAYIPARLEKISDSPIVIIDGAHNPNGAGALADAISTLLPDTPVTAVMGVLRDKDYSREMEILSPYLSDVNVCDGFSERCLCAEEFAHFAEKYLPARAFDSPESAFDDALNRARRSGGAVIICGSLYLAGKLHGYVKKKNTSQ